MLELVVALALLAIGYGVGSVLERRHYASIEQRERALVNQPSIPSEIIDESVRALGLATGSVVISVDHFKRFVAGLRNLVGGRVTSYETLLDRARREAVLRMKESFPEAHMFLNVRLETSIIGGESRQGIVCVEVCAYGTAVQRSRGGT